MYTVRTKSGRILGRYATKSEAEARLHRFFNPTSRRLTAAQKKEIAFNVEGSAIANAGDTVPGEYSQEWHEVFIATLRSLRDSLQSDREFGSYAPRMLTAKEAYAIVDPIIRANGEVP